MTAYEKPAFEAASRYADPADMARVFALQKSQALKLRTSTAEERIAKLRRLREAILASSDAIHAALREDLSRPAMEVELSELMPTIKEADTAIRHLKGWMKPKRVSTPLPLAGTFSHVRYEPLGACLIVAPWNFPLNLALIPLISAIAAGNTAIIKPSEFTPATNRVLRTILEPLFHEEEVAVFEGEAETSQQLLDMPFDHIFFTGSPAVGKIVMGAAAKHLTSVTLELGGKSPVIVDRTADISKAARSIAFGKHQNAGQICIAPDYVLVHDEVHDAFVAAMRDAVRTYTGAPEQQQDSTDFGRIISERHAARLKALIDDAVEKGAEIAYGGNADAAARYVQPTALTNVPEDALVLEEEIFGPVLPIIRYSDLDGAIAWINANPKPLALYVYSQDETVIRTVDHNTSSGNLDVNTCVLHYANHNLPFGGVNNSGIGKAHGFYGFKAFSHEKGVMRNRFAASLLFAPPYRSFMLRLIRLIVRRF